MTLPLDITPFFSGSTLSYAATGLPAGLALNGSTGLISGNPTTPGVSAVTVTASNAAGSAQQNFQWTITAAASVPDQVTGLVASPGDGQVTLSWDEPSNNGAAITDYVIERQIAGGGFVTLNDGTGTGRSFVDTGLANDTLHEYRVSAVNSEGTGPASAVASATPASSATAPGQVTGLVATAGDGQVSLSWAAPSDGGSPITDYVIEVDTGAGFSTISDGTGTATSFVHTGLTNGVAHTYRVSAVNAIGTGPASATSSATPVSSATAPGQVTGLTATPADGEVSLSWTAPSDGGSPITDYVIEVDTGAGFSTISDGTGTATSFVHTGLTNGVAHTYRVAAVNAIGTGAVSATASATPAAAGSSASIVLRDTAVSGASSAVYTFPGVSIGTGDLFLATFHRNGASTSGVTVGGVSMTKLGDRIAESQVVSVWRLDGQSAATADIVITLGAIASRCGMAVWTVDNAGVAEVAFGGPDPSHVNSATVNASASGLLLGYSSAINTAEDFPAMTFSNATAFDLGGGVFVEEFGLNKSVFHGLGDRATSAAQPETVTVTHSTSSSLETLALIAVASA